MKDALSYLVGAGLLLLFCLLGEEMCLLPWPRFLGVPSVLLLHASVWTFLPALAAIPAALYFGLRSIARRKERDECLADIARAFISVAFAVLYFPIWGIGLMHRTEAFARAAENGNQVVTALAAYRAENGDYPESLEKLIPTYLKEIPFTGMIGYPEFRYVKGYNDLEKVDDSYELRINCSSGTINFDRFIYWPSEEYPDRIQNNGTQPIGNWVYVHE